MNWINSTCDPSKANLTPHKVIFREMTEGALQPGLHAKPMLV